MKRAFLLICLIAFSWPIMSQSILNTSWKGYYEAIMDTITVNIDSNTFKADNSVGMNLITSHVEEYGDTMLIRDLSGAANICPLTDTGYYRFTITNDTLRFFLILDSCLQRMDVLDSAVLWRNSGTPTLLESDRLPDFVNVYPSPAKGRISFQSSSDGSIEIRDISGRIVLVRKFSPGQTRLALNPGMYSVLFRSSTLSTTSLHVVD